MISTAFPGLLLYTHLTEAAFDHWIAAGLVPLAIWILLSGLDDLFIAIVFLVWRRSRFPWPAEADLERAAERRIAILVPLWREHAVIGRMLDHNLSVLRYSNYDVFVGVYPNDQLTIRAVSEAAARYPRVHLALCPHDGPTSKGDCLNQTYRHLQAFETRRRVRFEVLTIHDAEDLMHPDSLRLINWFSRRYDMVQVPVLPLPTPPGEFTHGLYCDEFAEYQTKDIPVRQALGGFLPSNGVGTGFRREALEKLAATRRGQIFDPSCLTEDYENGYLLHALGASQVFLPLHYDSAGPIATREFFPRTFRSAIRQRSRWVAGIALQGWEHHGWRAPRRQLYWFWRDRKGLVGNLISPFANALMLYVLAGHGRLVSQLPTWIFRLCFLTFLLSAVQISLRTACCARIYGRRVAALAPARMFWGNCINGLATAAALCQFASARLRRRVLAWRKTDHHYPAHSSGQGRQPLGQVLIRMRCLSREAVEDALRSLPPGVRLGEYLVRLNKLTEDHVYRALSAQAGIPLGLPPLPDLNYAATRALPLEAVRRWKVLPYRIAIGQLHVLTPEVPSDQMAQSLRNLTGLEIRFRLVCPADFDRVAADVFRRVLAGIPSPLARPSLKSAKSA